jgi:hypothetical protein
MMKVQINCNLFTDKFANCESENILYAVVHNQIVSLFDEFFYKKTFLSLFNDFNKINSLCKVMNIY